MNAELWQGTPSTGQSGVWCLTNHGQVEQGIAEGKAYGRWQAGKHGVAFSDLPGLGLPILGISQETTGGSLFVGCLPHQKECFLMHFGKHIFSWKTNHLLLDLYFRMKYYPLPFNRKKPATFTILHPPFFPVSVSLSSLHSE